MSDPLTSNRFCSSRFRQIRRDNFMYNAFSLTKFVVFVYLDLDVFVFNHFPIVIIVNDESLFDHILSSVLEDYGFPNLFYLLVGAIDIKELIRKSTNQDVATYIIGLCPINELLVNGGGIWPWGCEGVNNLIEIKYRVDAFLLATEVLATEDLNFGNVWGLFGVGGR
ncbi:hypothetical protein CR513_53547, partial [Mucuna pruriens]